MEMCGSFSAAGKERRREFFSLRSNECKRICYLEGNTEGLCSLFSRYFPLVIEKVSLHSASL